jgi:hypothetical protein
MNKKQLKALLKLWQRDNQGMTFLQFRRSAGTLIGDPSCWCVQWCGMFVGIETDGYTHT